MTARRRIGRRGRLLLALLGAILLGGYVVLCALLSGPRLAKIVSTEVNKILVGHMSVDAIYFKPWIIIDLLLGRPIRVEAVGYEVGYENQPPLLKVPHAFLDFDVGAVIAKGEVLLTDIEMPDKEGAGAFDIDPDTGFVPMWMPRAPSSGGHWRVRIQTRALPMAFELVLSPVDHIRVPHGTISLLLDISDTDTVLDGSINTQNASIDYVGLSAPLTPFYGRVFAGKGDTKHDLLLDGRATALGAPLVVTGGLRNIFAPPEEKVKFDMNITFKEAHALLGSLAVQIGIPPDVLRVTPLGSARGKLRIIGTPDFPMLVPEVSDLHVSLLEGPSMGPLAARGQFDIDKMLLTIDSLDGVVGAGRLKLKGKLDIKTPETPYVAGKVQLQHVAIKQWLGPDPPEILDGRVTGSTEFRGYLIASAKAKPPWSEISFEKIDFTLDRPNSDTYPEHLHLWGRTHLKGMTARLDGLSAEALGVAGRASGVIDLKRKRLDLSVAAASTMLSEVFAHFGLPATMRNLASSLTLEASATGTLTTPELTGKLKLGNVGLKDLRIPMVNATLETKKLDVRLTSLEGSGPSGNLRGSGALGLGSGAVSAQLTLLNLNLAKLSPKLGGTAEMNLTLGGTLKNPLGSFRLEANGLLLDREIYGPAILRASMDASGIRIDHLTLIRKQGGAIEAQGLVGADKSLDLKMTAKDFPLAKLPMVPQLPIPIRGTLSGQFHVGGTTKEPRPSGEVEVKDVMVRTLSLGQGRLEMIPGGDSIALRGRFFKRFALVGDITLGEVPAIHATMHFFRVPIEQMFPELEDYAELRGVTTGRIDAAVSAAGLQVIVTLTELSLTAQGVEEDGTARQVAVRNRGDIRIVWAGSDIRFEQLVLESDHGQVVAKGRLDQVASDLVVRGSIDLELLEYFTHRVLRHAHGQTVADLRIQGPMLQPEITGTLSIQKVMIEPYGLPDRVHIPSGKLTFLGKKVTLSELLVRVHDSRVTADGELDWTNFTHPSGRLAIDGQLHAKLIQMVLPSLFLQAHGKLDVQLRAVGELRSPALNGKIGIAAPGISFDLRGFSHEISIDQAEIQVTPEMVRIAQLRGKIDEGDVVIDGNLRWKGFDPESIYLSIRASELPFREPGILSLTLATQLVIKGDRKTGLLLTGPNGRPGSVDILEGRYMERFESPLKSAVIRPRTREETVPFWDGIPLLENMRLDCEVRSRGFFAIENNLARHVRLETNLRVGGTLQDPSLGGEIRVLEGAFTVPFVKGSEFIAVPGGTIVFSPSLRFPETPELNIEAEKTYTDNHDQDHLIRLRFSGRLGEPVWSLETNTGLNTAQTLLLLTTGRPPTELRSALRGEVRTRSTGSASDQLAKELSGGALQEIISEPLTRLLSLDAFSVYVGPDSVDVRGRKRLILRPRLDLIGSQSIGILNRSQFQGRLQLKLHDSLFIEGDLQRFTRGLETEQESLDRGKVQVRFLFRLR